MRKLYSASVVKCHTYNPDELFLKVKEAIGLIGGIEKFIQPNSKILLKPNLLMDVDPEKAITTHPEFVRAVIKILRGVNCKIYLGDSPSVFGGHIEDILKVYESTGIKAIAREENVELVTFEKRFIQDSLLLAQWIKECDYVVNLPKLKTHSFMVMTAGVKNLFGLVPGVSKLEAHKNFYQPEKFAGMLLDIYGIVKPALTVIDAIQGIEGDGPATSGIKRDFGFVLAASDALAADTVLAKIMNLKSRAIYTNQEAMRRKLSAADLNNIDISGKDAASFGITDIKLPRASLKQALIYRLPEPLARLLKRMLYFHPRIDSDVCRLCEACIKNCPQKTMSNKNGRIVIDYAQCISCFCCQEVCPYAAIGTKKSLLAKIMGM
ncbi:DUF362 domain-containing protein [bacterium]|nr:MAG: DUF362 domain-containing protein [bacterium]